MGSVLLALLAVLGVDLIVIVVLLAIVVARRRWIGRQPGSFTGALRLFEGEEQHADANWQRGRGRWVGTVLVWSKAPLLLRSTLVAVHGLAGEVRVAGPGEVKRLGSTPVIVPMVAERGARVMVAAAGADRDLALGPWNVSVGGTAADGESDSGSAAPGSRRRSGLSRHHSD
jgi:hypothetical protein